ncbi:hypothetical protein LSH36_915g00080 [Paralvinella palmiformis]|uniref:Uncharacterized protein n=1 Tax=Paralvinella palmiformis TaxID=53620 RepID=A0AAD9IXM0_9ANNE|nr:hypothetical protein LSH36_915g00080 [Paralvinella palmiformis]
MVKTAVESTRQQSADDLWHFDGITAPVEVAILNKHIPSFRTNPPTARPSVDDVRRRRQTVHPPGPDAGSERFSPQMSLTEPGVARFGRRRPPLERAKLTEKATPGVDSDRFFSRSWILVERSGFRPLIAADRKWIFNPDINAIFTRERFHFEYNVSNALFGLPWTRFLTVLSNNTIEYKYLADYTNPCWLDDRELRCLPHFYVIGVGRSGTTMVYKLLTKHQNVVKPRRKELAMWQDITKRKLNSSTNQKCRKRKTNA